MITLVHEARYTARPSRDHGPTETKAGAPRYEITFDLLEDGKPSGTTLRYSGSLDGDYADRTFATLKTCGAKGEDINALVLDYDTEVVVKAKSREYNGKTLFEAQFVDPIRRTMAAGKAASFTDRLRAALGTAPTQPAPAKPVAKTPWGAAKTG